MAHDGKFRKESVTTESFEQTDISNLYLSSIQQLGGFLSLLDGILDRTIAKRETNVWRK